MACENHANYAFTYLLNPVGIFDPSIDVVSSVSFPSAPYRIRINTEIMLVTSTLGNTWFVDRGEEGTSPVAHAAGDFLVQTITAQGLLNSIECYSQSGPFASLPTATSDKVGRLFLSENPGWMLARNQFDNTWRTWTGIYQLEEPSDSGFSWVNQGSASVVTANGGIQLIGPVGSGSEDVHLRVQNVSFSLPISAPYSLTVGFLAGLYPDNQTSCGLVFRESSTGKFIFFRLKFDDTVVSKHDLVISIDKYNSPTSLNSNYQAVSASTLNAPLIWFKMEDDGANLIFKISNDNKKFITIDSRVRTDFLLSGPDEIGIAVNSTTTSGGVYINLFSFKKE